VRFPQGRDTQKTDVYLENEGIKPENEGIKPGHEGINATLNSIEKNPGIRIPMISASLSISSKTIERWISILKKQDAIEYRGSKKSGGYYKK